MNESGPSSGRSAAAPGRGTPGSSRAWPLALVAGLPLALFFGKLLDPRLALATRDMVEFHLPLRSAWRELVHRGSFFPQWDSFAHGGQPLISNPNYGALYPPSWLGLVLPATYAIGLLAALHAAIACFGAARLARSLGADPPSAALAGLAFSCGATYLSLLHSLPLALGMSWLPWVLALGRERLVVPPDPAHARRAVNLSCGLAVVLGLLLVTGDPVLLAMTALGLVALSFAAPAPGPWTSRLAALAPGLIAGVGLSAAQLLPTLARLRDTPRASGIDFESAATWSFPWARLPELLLPQLYGDVSRPMVGLFFGWGVHDLDFPYLLLVSVTAPILFLGVAGLLSPGLPLRSGLVTLAMAGVFLALGRHNPLFRLLFDFVPGVSALRYPEKFLLLSLVALVLAAALHWSRMLAEREAGAARSAELPLALAVVGLLTTCVLFALVSFAPATLEGFLAGRSGWTLSSAEQLAARAFYLEAGWRALAFALSTLALFCAARFTRLPRALLHAALVVLVASELWVHARPLLRTVAVDQLLARPAVLNSEEASAPPSGSRIFSTESFQSEANPLVPRSGDLVLNWVRAPIDRLDARAAGLFGLRYALDKDFDLTLTGSAARALALYGSLRGEPALAHRYLGAWSVDRLVVQRSPLSILDDLRKGATVPRPVYVAGNSFALPAARFVGSFSSHSTPAGAAAAAVAAGLPLNEREFVASTKPVESTALGVGVVVDDDDRGDIRRIAYESARPSLLVVATTFDRQWVARLEGDELDVLETAGGYLAVLVPAGSHTVELRFRDAWFRAGAALTGITFLVLVLAVMRVRGPRDASRLARSAPPATS